MATGKITIAVLDSASYERGDRFIWDSALKGFGAKVNRNGSISFVVQTRTGGRKAGSKRQVIGAYGPMKLDEARSEARKALGRIHLSQPLQSKGDDKAVAKASPAFDEVSELFISIYLQVNWKRQWSEAAKDVRSVLRPAFAGLPVDEIGRSEINSLLDSYADRLARQKNLHSLIRLFLNWSVERDYIERSPLAGLKGPKPRPPRTRFLCPREVWAVWHATGELDYPFGPLFRLLLLTGQRRSQLAALRWEQIRRLLEPEAAIMFSSTQMKMDREFFLPLSTLAANEFVKLHPAQEGFVFTTTGKRPISGFSRAKSRLDELVGARLKDAYGDPAKSIADWRIHDLRRTIASALQSAGFPIEITEAVLDHRAGKVSGISRVYHLYDYEAEKRAALARWSAYVGHIVTCADPHSVSDDWRTLAATLNPTAAALQPSP